jgi:hypothetical protein
MANLNTVGIPDRSYDKKLPIIPGRYLEERKRYTSGSGSISLDTLDTAAAVSTFFDAALAVEEGAAFFGVADFEADFIATTK